MSNTFRLKAEEVPDPSGHLCLFLLDEEIHINLGFPDSIPLEVLAAAVAELVHQTIIETFMEAPDGDARSASIQ